MGVNQEVVNKIDIDEGEFFTIMVIRSKKGEVI